MCPRWGILVQFYGQSRISQVTLGQADWPLSPAFWGGQGWRDPLALWENVGLRQDRHRIARGEPGMSWRAEQRRLKFARSMTAPLPALPGYWSDLETALWNPGRKLAWGLESASDSALQKRHELASLPP